ncbi:MAG: metal ABC transporter permease [Deltaproteobacteria bacterium]|nr:metal ABC transporter permease [Deltaproteobacteria bacterium]
MDANLLYVVSGSVLFGISAGVLGCFAFLRKRALMGDALAHAALPGVCLAYLLTGGMKHPLLFIVGAAASGLLGSFALNTITRRSRIKEDAAIGLVLSVFFGVGIMLLTYIQHQPLGNQSGLDKFLFGQAASLIGRDIYLFGSLALVVLIAMVLAYKELKVIAFDPGFATGIGVPIGWMDTFLTVLIVLVVVAGLQAVGVVLMAAMVITPAAAARQWTDRLTRMLGLAGLFGATAGAVGAVTSALAPRMPTGPWIVIAITAIFAVSIAFAPRHGMLPRWWRHARNATRINRENILKTLYRLREDQPALTPTIDLLRRYRHLSVGRALRLLQQLARMRLVEQGGRPEEWQLTPNGIRAAESLVRRHRLWEVYLTQYLQLGKGQVHADAEEIEHVLTPELEVELEALLHRPRLDPHARPIPYERGGA